MGMRGSASAVAGGVGIRAALGALVIMLVAISACGGEPEVARDASYPNSPAAADSPTQADPPSATIPPGLPECDTVWRVGERLPRAYAGCTEGETYREKDAIACSSGQQLLQHVGRFYAVAGGVVKRARPTLDESLSYRKDLEQCRA